MLHFYSAVASNAQCLTNVLGSQPTDYLTQNLMPGQFFTANDQCQMVYGSSSGLCQVNSHLNIFLHYNLRENNL